MQTSQSPKKARVGPRARKSIAHLPTQDVNGDKENITVDIAAATAAASKSIAQGKALAKKPRSKSIGPGGLDALKEDTGNRRQSTTAPFVRSILKTTLSHSPPKRLSPRSITPRASPKKSSPVKSQDYSLSGPSVSERSNLLSGNHEVQNALESPSEPNRSNGSLSSPSRHQTLVAVRSEEQQQATAKERERHENLAHKDARRKSLANRRVSFAPEATLHTWDVVELPEDSTTSSASTNPTRRASALSAIAASPYPQPRSPMPSSDVTEPLSTPRKEAKDLPVFVSPAHQRKLHQGKRRRSSGIPPMDFNNPNDFSSSPCSEASAESNNTERMALMMTDDKNQSSDSDHDDSVNVEGTISGINIDVSNHSVGNSSTGSSGRLEEALRQAAEQAGTQGIDYDENGDITMEIADEEVTMAFQPWINESKQVLKVPGIYSALQDQENINPFSPAFKAETIEQIKTDEVERTMEFTQAIGTILPQNACQVTPSKDRQDLLGPKDRRRSSGASRRSSCDASISGEVTMDLTAVVGNIQQNESALQVGGAAIDLGFTDEDEELTMEFTSVVGGVLGRDKEIRSYEEPTVERRLSGLSSFGGCIDREGDDFSNNDEDMDITLSTGKILPSITERTEPPDDQTMNMNITKAIGVDLPQQLRSGSRLQAKLLMEQESETGTVLGSLFYAGSHSGPEILNHTATIASETGSPSLATSYRRGNSTKSLLSKQSTTPKSDSRQITPKKKPTTPPKQLNPTLTRPTTPGKTPPSKNVTLRVGSPEKLFQVDKNVGGFSPHQILPNPFNGIHSSSAQEISSIILKPRIRRSSGLGIDKEGLGSPRVSELLNKRRSIGEDAAVFTVRNQASRTVVFEDPQKMEAELEQQRADDKSFKDGREILQTEVSGLDLEEEKDATASLKDMIESLTPRKKKLNGRKSLHVGAAKGLLGKRPAELDEDDEDEDVTPKRLKGREGSPVKKIRLPAPPAKTETTGRMTRSGRRSLGETTDNINISTPSRKPSPLKNVPSTTPKNQPRFKDADIHSTGKRALESIGEKLDSRSSNEVDPSEEHNRIHLQDFLNMTSIRFMELTTTKRRLTVAPNVTFKDGVEDASAAGNESELERCVVSGACTIPMLELYQHSCRELKKYIAEGRSIVREIEADTYEENPPVFREYISAPLEIKSIMDNQFKNVKTHARLLSKAMWYEWRMKLLDGLKEGLLKIADGMNEDDVSLSQQEQLLEPNLSIWSEEHERLEAEQHTLQAQADDLASCDQEELKDARESLVAIEDELQIKQRLIKKLQDELRSKEDRIELAVDSKQQHLDAIKEAEKIQQECRGWSSSEVIALQASVDALETAHGWMISSVADKCLTMTYKQALRLFFCPRSFKSCSSPLPSNVTDDSPISLTYIADVHEYHPQPLTTEKRFFLQIMRAQLQCLPQSRTRTKDLLGFVSGIWEEALRITEEARILGISYITDATILSDEAMHVRSVVLLRDMRTKVDVGFQVMMSGMENAVERRVIVRPCAKVLYGEELKEKKMTEFLDQKTEGGTSVAVGSWAAAVRELEEKLIARGKK